MEVFKDIPGYENMYQVSSNGIVRGVDRIDARGQRVRGKVLGGGTNSTGYRFVVLHKFGKTKAYKVHQLVAMAFLNHNPCGMKLVVDHINNINTDNSVENLRVITQRENSSMSHRKSVSKYTGVGWSNRAKKWRAYTSINRKYIHLGYFLTELEAHNAYTNYYNKNKII